MDRKEGHCKGRVDNMLMMLEVAGALLFPWWV